MENTAKIFDFIDCWVYRHINEIDDLRVQKTLDYFYKVRQEQLKVKNS